MKKSKISFNDIIEYAKKLWKYERREFCIIASKASFSFLFFLTLFFKFYYGGVFGNIIKVSPVQGLKSPFIYVLVFLGLFIGYTLTALMKNKKLSNTIFKANTIISIIFFLFMLMVYSVDTEDITTKGLSFGALLEVIFIAFMILLAFKESLIMNIFYKIFKIPRKVEIVEEIKEAEVVEEPTEIVEEPVETVEEPFEVVEEPVEVVEEPIKDEVVKVVEEQEEIVEESTEETEPEEIHEEEKESEPLEEEKPKE